MCAVLLFSFGYTVQHYFSGLSQTVRMDPTLSHLPNNYSIKVERKQNDCLDSSVGVYMEDQVYF